MEITSTVNSEVGKSIAQVLSTRQRVRQTTDLRTLFGQIQREVDNTFKYEDMLKAFQHLARAGVGRLVIGRNNNPDRFQWNYNFKEAFRAGQENKPLAQLRRIEGRIPRKRKPIVQPTATTPVKTTSQNLKPLPPFIEVRLHIPQGANVQEVEALLELAKTLQK